MMRFTDAQITAAKEIDLLSYLQSFEPGNLRHLGRNTYCLRDHDSLKISNGKWHWFSQHIGGKNALDYLMKVRGFSFVEAMHQLSPETAIPVYEYREPEYRERSLQLPKLELGIQKVTEYLMKRGISREVIDYCFEKEILFEDSEYHNCIFLGYDGSTPKFGAVRSTVTDFKRDLSGSDKRFSFCIPAPAPSGTVHLFEAAIDAMSYATIRQNVGTNVGINGGINGNGEINGDINGELNLDGPLLSLSGVYAGDSIPLALKTYLDRNPQTKEVVLHLDNDEVGRRATEQITKALQGKYTIRDEPAPFGKDWNDYLQAERQKQKQRKELTR